MQIDCTPSYYICNKIMRRYINYVIAYYGLNVIYFKIGYCWFESSPPLITLYGIEYTVSLIVQDSYGT